MQFRSENVRPLHPRRLLPAVMVLLGLIGWSGEAHASSISSPWGVEAEVQAQAHHCKCRSRCRGASCCCDHGEAPALPAPPPSDAPSSVGFEFDANPCLNEAPCGDPGLPTGSPRSHVGKAAALAMGGPPGPEGPRGFLTAPTSCVLPARRASRLDEPPEGLPLA